MAIRQSRRKFLKNSLLTGIGATGCFGALRQFPEVQAAIQNSSFSDYKALVCIMLDGGNDSYNMFIPTEESAYSSYAGVRNSLAIANDEKLRNLVLQGDSPGDTSSHPIMKMHPSLEGFRSLFNDKKLAVVSNVGALVSPASRVEIKAKQATLPDQLFSHNSQIAFWERAGNDLSQRNGWAGRIADEWSSKLVEGSLPLNISFAGNNHLQSAFDTTPFMANTKGIPNPLDNNKVSPIDPRVVLAYENHDRDGLLDEIFNKFQKEHENSSSHLFEKVYGKIAINADAQSQMLASLLDGLKNDFNTAFQASGPWSNPVDEATPLGRAFAQFIIELKEAARMIHAAKNSETYRTSNMRQIFYIKLSGWDTHDDQLNIHQYLLQGLSSLLKDFYSLVDGIGYANNVTAFTTSDFGRTMTSNGDGTDHGWGGHQVVIGGAVSGGRFYGHLPPQRLYAEDDTSTHYDLKDGRMIPSTSIDEYSATLAQWFGLDPINGQQLDLDSLKSIFPNLSNFTDNLTWRYQGKTWQEISGWNDINGLGFLSESKL